jgi:hypothetical protein
MAHLPPRAGLSNKEEENKKKEKRQIPEAPSLYLLVEAVDEQIRP